MKNLDAFLHRLGLGLLFLLNGPLTKAETAHGFDACVPPTFSFSVTPTGRSAVNLSNANGPSSGSVQLCAGLTQAQTYGNLVRSATNVGIRGKTTAANNATAGGAPVAVEPYFDLGTNDGLSIFFNYTFGSYGVSSGSQGTFSQSYTPYVDANLNGQFDAGECEGNPITLNVTINAKPYFGFTVASNGVPSQAVSSQNGATSFSAKACVGSNSALQFSSFSRSAANVGVLLQTTATTGKPTYFGNAIAAGAPQDLGTETTFTNFFTGTFGAYGIADNAVQATFTQTYTPYVDLNGDTNYDPGECLGDPITLNATINALPVLNATASPNPVCLDGTLSLQANASGGGGSFSYDWSGPNGYNPDPTATNPLTRPNATTAFEGIYQVTVTDANGCQATGQTAAVSVSQPQLVGSASVGANLTVCAGQLLTVSFATGACSFPVGNVFKVELSDKNGSFANPVALPGAVNPGLSTVTIPTGTPAGNGYQVRVVSSQPGLTSGTSEPFKINASGSVAVAQFPTTPASICQGDALPVTFSTTGACPFPLENTFTVQLSNAFGSFANPTILGTALAGTTTFPASALNGLPAGTGYRVRIVSSNPAQTSAASLPFKLEGPNLALTPAVDGAPVCRGNELTVNFTLASCPFPNGNAFTAQLSSATGSFNNPTNLGPVTPGQANQVTIPAGVSTGSGYRIRIVSSQPVLTSSSSASFQVKACNSRLSAEEASLVVAPNPVVGREIRVRVSGMDSPSFSLTTSTGRSLEISSKSDGAGEHVLTPRQVLAAGVYLLQASEGSQRLTQRVLVSQ